MKQYAKGYQLKNKAKDNLSGKYSIVILGLFLFELMLIGIRFIFFFPYLTDTMMSMLVGGGQSVASLRLSQAGDLISQVFSGYMQFGLAYICLNIVCKRDFQYKDIFFGFRREYIVKILILSAVTVFVNLVCLLPWQHFANKFLNTWDYTQLLIAALVLAIGSCVYIPLSLALNLTNYLLLDFPDRKATTIIRDSFHIIKGHRKRFFLLQLSFLPLYIVCQLTLGIGSLWLVPYMHMTFVLFYLDLMNPKQQG